MFPLDSASSSWPPFLHRYFRPTRRAKTGSSFLHPSQAAQQHHPLSRPIVTNASPPKSMTSTSIPPPPISRLPVELLIQIFIQVPRAEFYDSLHSHNAPPPAQRSQPTWVSVTQVCRHWSAITINCKAFWSFIPLAPAATTQKYWVELSLARSDPYPVSLLVDCSSSQTESYHRIALATLRATLARARDIHLQNLSPCFTGMFAKPSDPEFLAEVLRVLDTSPAPLLETFNVMGHTALDVVVPSDDIFQGCTPPALRSLTLACCDVRHSSPLFRAPLTSLHLDDCFLEFPLEVLGLLPHLRTLILENTRGVNTRVTRRMTRSRRKDSFDNEALRFPHLQRLELTNLSAVIAFLLQAIQLPSSSSVSITCTDCLELDEPLDDLTLLHTITSNMSPVLSTHLERVLAEDRAFAFLEIASPTSTSKKTLVLLDPASAPTTADPAASEPRQLLFSLVWASTTHDSNDIDIFTQMLSALPPAALRQIHTLRMCDALSSSSSSLRAADARSRPNPFATYHDKARDEAVRGLLAIVMRQELLPALRLVSLEDIDFKHLDVDLLARVLVHRQRTAAISGGKIGLSLQNCLMNLGTIRGLRDCLGPDAVDVGYAAKRLDPHTRYTSSI
jgi:hypothetical protein